MALKHVYQHYIHNKYASSIIHIADKYPPLSDDVLSTEQNDIKKEDESNLYQHKFYKPSSYTDPLFNPKSSETKKLRSEFNQLFLVLNTMRDYIIRDFIDSWYRNGVSSDDTKFINHIKFALDGVFQILVKRISSTNWTYFIRDRIFHPLRECLILYKNIIHDLSKNNPKWNDMTEIERYTLYFFFMYISLHSMFVYIVMTSLQRKSKHDIDGIKHVNQIKHRLNISENGVYSF